MKTLMDPSFEYIPAAETDIRKRFKRAELEQTIFILNEVAEYLENCSDVVDGSYGEPHPNRAMTLLRDLETLIAKLKSDER